MELLDILSAIFHFLWDWTGALKSLMIVVGLVLIFAGAMNVMQPVPPIAGFVTGPLLIAGSLWWIVYDVRNKKDVYY